jgi:putative tryptophan/tyrosine transport system substrate-binding protein
MRRRDFIGFACGALSFATSWHAAGQAASRTYRIGFLSPGEFSPVGPIFEELRRNGFVEGQNLAVDRRDQNAGYRQLAAAALELVRTSPDAIITAGPEATRAAQAATMSVPIVAITDDMVGEGLARSLAQPGGNTTGISLLASDLDGKRQELLIDFTSAAPRIAALADTRTTGAQRLRALSEAARSRGVILLVQSVEKGEEIGPAIDRAKAEAAAALNVLASPLLHAYRHVIIRKTAAMQIPAIYQWPEIVHDGGLLGYGPRLDDVMRQLGRQIVEILGGSSPASHPIRQPANVALAINLKTAKEIGLTIASSFIVRADEVIE